MMFDVIVVMDTCPESRVVNLKSESSDLNELRQSSAITWSVLLIEEVKHHV